MSMYGADVAELRSLAAQFDRTADQLDANRMTVGNAIQISAWVGPFATHFRLQWDSEHSRRIHVAAELLRSGARALRSNADDQERASAVDGAPGMSPGVNWGHAAPIGTGRGQHPFSWLNDTVMGAKPFAGIPVLDVFDVGFFASKVPGLGEVVTGISLADTFIDPNVSLTDKLWAAGGGFVDAASGSMKSMVIKAGPVPYLAGVAAAQIFDVVDLARQADFSPEGVQTTWDFMMTNPGEAVQGAAEGIVRYIPDLVNNFWPW